MDIKIDGTKLKNELKKRGVSMVEACAEIGYSSTYLSYCTRKGEISNKAVLLLEKTFGIKPDVYVEGIEKEAEKPTEFDWNKLYEVIYTATYHATKKALEG